MMILIMSEICTRSQTSHIDIQPRSFCLIKLGWIMGHSGLIAFNRFDDLILPDETCIHFDVVKNIIQYTNILQKDTASFMKEDATFLSPVYELCHEELFMLMWNVKYKELFLPENWIAVTTDTCYNCDGGSGIKIGLHENDIYKIVFDHKLYCINCRHALYDIL
uniref:Uncharacterized protein n=1 Tax=Phthorimaea operculella granulovirus TaxID=192584 RepID=A0A1B2CS89_9BBAC|nr:hypothetical protein PhopGVgp111 [Phthorimaea operculella granulovirus]